MDEQAGASSTGGCFDKAAMESVCALTFCRARGRLRDVERRLERSYVTKPELYLTVFVATFVALTCIAGSWLVVEAI